MSISQLYKSYNLSVCQAAGRRPNYTISSSHFIQNFFIKDAIFSSQFLPIILLLMKIILNHQNLLILSLPNIYFMQSNLIRYGRQKLSTFHLYVHAMFLIFLVVFIYYIFFYILSSISQNHRDSIKFQKIQSHFIL